MISVAYNKGIVLGMSEIEALEVRAYLAYSDYMFEKLLPTNAPESHSVSTLQRDHLRVLYGRLCTVPPFLRTSLRYEQQVSMLGWNFRSHLHVIADHPVLVPFHTVTVGIGEEMITVWRGYSGTLTSLTERLAKRLPKEKFPSPEAFISLVGAMRGVTFAGGSSTSMLPLYQNHRWEGTFPTIFQPVIDLTSWTATAREIMQVFALDRRVSPGVVEKVLKVKL